MQLIEKQITASYLKAVDTLSPDAENDAQELIRHNITNDIINISDFAHDIDNEVYVLMTNGDTPYHLALDSGHFNIAIYWAGLFKGVRLDEHDIEKVVDNLKYYVVVNGGPAEFIDDLGETVEASN